MGLSHAIHVCFALAPAKWSCPSLVSSPARRRDIPFPLILLERLNTWHCGATCTRDTPVPMLTSIWKRFIASIDSMTFTSQTKCLTWLAVGGGLLFGNAVTHY